MVDGSKRAPSPSTTPADPTVTVGTDFPLTDGRRSSAAVGREVFARAADPVDRELAAHIRGTANWRADYVDPCRELVVRAAQSADNAAAIAAGGLAALHEKFVFAHDGMDIPLAEAVGSGIGKDLADVAVYGTGDLDASLVVPFRGRRLSGPELRRQLARWVGSGTAEPSFNAAVNRVMDNADWLDLRGVHIVLIGAGAELGPLRQLLAWGADVWAIDLPRPQIWKRIIAAVQGTAGTLHVPVPAAHVLPEEGDLKGLANMAGVDVIADTPAIRRWLETIDADFVLGQYGYADGALHVRLSMATDAIAADLLGKGRGITLAYLATPTDAFAVPSGALAESRRRWASNRLARAVRRPLSPAHLFQQGYQHVALAADGREVGIADCIVPQQGPNYLLAKRMQRFRAVVSRSDGVRVSLNVAPPARTQSVVKNKALAAAYAGAARFGIEVFDPDTCNTLMAALLVRDLRDPQSLSNPAVPTDSPMDLFGDAANHGGLWRTEYDPRSVLGVAAIMGMFVRGA